MAVVFPAVVSSDSFNATRAKVFISATQAWIALDLPTGPAVVDEFDVEALAVLGNGVYELTKSDGSVVQIRAGGGCGCGSKLRQWSPFSGPLRLGT